MITLTELSLVFHQYFTPVETHILPSLPEANLDETEERKCSL